MPTDKDRHRELFPALQRAGVMNPQTPMDLIVQPYFFIFCIFVATQLDPVHTQIGLHDLFGEGGGQRLADKFQVPLLASGPILPEIREGGDAGAPAASVEGSEAAKIFDALALKLVEILDTKQNAQPQLKIVN